MAELKKIQSDKAPAAIGPYSQGIVSSGFVFTSGQIPLDPQTGELVGSDITAQAQQVMQNLQAVLEAGGSDTSHVIKTTCFLASMDDFAAFNAVYEKFMPENPARSCVAVRTLPRNVLVEVEAVAALV